jgi:arylsulfatase A-like enzyme
MTGMYPQFTGTEFNEGELNTTIKTWADILRDEKDYATSYMGKWHLDGDAKPVSNCRILLKVVLLFKFKPYCFSYVEDDFKRELVRQLDVNSDLMTTDIVSIEDTGNTLMR